jgi:hypothetical protein
MNISAVVRTKILTLLLGVFEVYPIVITNPGTGYTAGALIVDNTGTGGSGLAGTYTVSTGTNAVTRVNPTPVAEGIGYSVDDILTLVGGIGCTLKVLTVDAGKVKTYQLLTGGTGYTIGTKTTTVAPAGGNGCQILVTALNSGVITGLSITNKGSGYHTIPVVTPQAGGAGAVLTPSLFGFFPELAPMGTHSPFMTYHWITDPRDPLINVARPWIQLNLFHTDYNAGLVLKESIISGLDKTKAVIGGTEVIYMSYLGTQQLPFETDTKLWHWAIEFKLAYKEA